ncbi:MAG: sugar phosphate isomerase/epimerase [Clostridiales bacterium]|nr:sugar phosphate isomerase/epimerase [Clostridiales bacterium]
MKIGVSSYSFNQALQSGRETQLSIISKAKEMGFDGIEFVDLDVPQGLTEAEYASIVREECEKVGLPVIAYTVSADMLSDSGLDSEVERVCKKADIASVLGAGCMRHDAAWSVKDYYTFENALPVIAKGCRAVNDYASSLGIVTMIENHGYFCQNSLRVEKIISSVNSVNFGALIDIGNFTCVDENCTDAVRRLLPFAKHIHAKDFHIKSGSEFNPGRGFFKSGGGNYLRGAVIGQGNVPVYQCVQLIKNSGYDSFISVEFEGVEDCFYGIEAGLENLRKMSE